MWGIDECSWHLSFTFLAQILVFNTVMVLKSWAKCSCLNLKEICLHFQEENFHPIVHEKEISDSVMTIFQVNHPHRFVTAGKRISKSNPVWKSIHQLKRFGWCTWNKLHWCKAPTGLPINRPLAPSLVPPSSPLMAKCLKFVFLVLTSLSAGGVLSKKAPQVWN